MPSKAIPHFITLVPIFLEFKQNLTFGKIVVNRPARAESN
jgi:hypothetical protein